jgi:hypothetical protein
MKPTINKVLSKSKNPVRRLLGFREWCEMVWEPSKEFRRQRSLLPLTTGETIDPYQGTMEADNGGKEVEGRRSSPAPRSTG